MTDEFVDKLSDMVDSVSLANEHPLAGRSASKVLQMALEKVEHAATIYNVLWQGDETPSDRDVKGGLQIVEKAARDLLASLQALNVQSEATQFPEWRNALQAGVVGVLQSLQRVVQTPKIASNVGECWARCKRTARICPASQYAAEALERQLLMMEDGLREAMEEEDEEDQLDSDTLQCVKVCVGVARNLQKQLKKCSKKVAIPPVSFPTVISRLTRCAELVDDVVLAEEGAVESLKAQLLLACDAAADWGPMIVKLKSIAETSF